MRLPDLLGAARLEFRDPGILDPELIGYANDALKTAAGEVFLPDLETAAVVAVPARAKEAALPADFQRHLYAARRSDGMRLTVLERPWQQKQADLDFRSPGGILQVAAVGRSRLRVWPVPLEDTAVIVSYFRYPRTLEQAAGDVAFEAATKTLTSSVALFGRFRAGDIFMVDSAANAGTYTVVTATDRLCSVAEDVADEAAQLVNVSAADIEAIPEEEQYDVLVTAILARVYATKEDYRDGKPNADAYEARARLGRRDLKVAINRMGYRAPAVEARPPSGWVH